MIVNYKILTINIFYYFMIFDTNSVFFFLDMQNASVSETHKEKEKSLLNKYRN